MKEIMVGVDLGGTNIKAAAFCAQSLDRLWENRIPTQADRGWEAVLGRIVLALEPLWAQASKDRVACVGVGVPGLLDIEEGISYFSPNFPQWKDVPVAAWLKERLALPVFIDNDVRVNLYGEWLQGAGRGKRNVVLLTLGTGLGSGIVMDGHVRYGTTSSAGEIGHMNMVREGRPCKCGSSGCLGRYVSALGMLRTLWEKLQAGQPSVILDWVGGELSAITADMVSRAYDLGDPAAVETMRETGELLGFGLVNVINLFNPEVVIVGGGMAAAGERLLGPARRVVDTHALELSRQSCQIVTAQLGDAAGMLGAALYGRQRLHTGSRL